MPVPHHGLMRPSGGLGCQQVIGIYEQISTPPWRKYHRSPNRSVSALFGKTGNRYDAVQAPIPTGMYPTDGDADTLLKHAGIAMYAARARQDAATFAHRRCQRLNYPLARELAPRKAVNGARPPCLANCGLMPFPTQYAACACRSAGIHTSRHGVVPDAGPKSASKGRCPARHLAAAGFTAVTRVDASLHPQLNYGKVLAMTAKYLGCAIFRLVWGSGAAEPCMLVTDRSVAEQLTQFMR